MWKRSKNEVTVTVEEPAAVTNFVNEVLHQADKAAADGTDWMADTFAVCEIKTPRERAKEAWMASVTEALQQRAQQYRDDQRIDAPQITVECWVSEDPSRFCYTDLVPDKDYLGNPRGEGTRWPWWRFLPRNFANLNLDQHLEYRQMLAEDGFRFVPWQDLEPDLQYQIMLYALPQAPDGNGQDWYSRLTGDENDAYVLERLMVYVKGDL